MNDLDLIKKNFCNQLRRMKYVSATKEYTTFRNHIPAPLFRKSFVLNEIPQEAPVIISGLGFYDLYINGEKITKGLLAPYISNPDDVVYYDYYNIAPYLSKGENVIGVILGNGMQNNPGGTVWFFDEAKYIGAPKFALEATIGELQITAKDFVCSESAILFDDLRCGVAYDATKEQEGWNKPGFDQSSWRAVLDAEIPRGELRECIAEPIRIRQEIKPVSVTNGSMKPYITLKNNPMVQATDFPYSDYETENGYIYDFGINTAGIPRLTINGKAGQTISLFCCETIEPDGDFDISCLQFYPKGYTQRMIYNCKGGMETFEPPFTYYGFRYIFVTGITKNQATPELLTYLEAHSDLKKIGDFSCSDEITNKLFEMADRSDRSNFYYFPTDCPHREKNGWTGDAAASAEHMILHLDTENSWREWMNNIRAAQNTKGALPGIVPTAGWGFNWGNGPAWDRVLFELPYMTYLYRGKTEMITENAHAMLRYLEYVSRCRDERGIIEMGLGDWTPVNAGNSNYLIPLGLSGSIMTVEMCRQAEVMFDAVHLSMHKQFAHTLREELLDAIRKEYIDFGTMTAVGNCQSSQAMCIYYNIFTDAEKPTAFARLMEILELDGFKMNTGYLGGRVLFHVLAKNGEAELAYRMITSTEFPGYGTWVKTGDTTLLESFHPSDPNINMSNASSHNHHFWGDISHWFMRHITGLNVNPFENDPDFVLVQPRFISTLDHAKAYYDTPKGRVSVEWYRKEENIFLTVRCEGEARVRIRLESGYLFEELKRSFKDEACEDAKIIIRS